MLNLRMIRRFRWNTNTWMNGQNTPGVPSACTSQMQGFETLECGVLPIRRKLPITTLAFDDEKETGAYGAEFHQHSTDPRHSRQPCLWCLIS